MIVLAGDVGGTNARLALVELARRSVRVLQDREYPSAEFARLEDIVRRFLAETGGRPERACFGVAGPVRGEEVRATNLPWVVSARSLGDVIGLEHTSLVNDLYAIALGIPRLRATDLVVLQEGEPQAGGACAVIAPGTGLGQAVLVRTGRGWRALPSEGGHASFAARDDLEYALRQWLAARHGHVSNERVLSGPGLVNLYQFLAARSPDQERGEVRAQIAREGPRAISRHALAGTDPLCDAALDRFCTVLGAVAGDLALITLAQGGVYVAGGIAPGILPRLRAGGFLAAFLDKGRMSELVARTPVRVVTNEQVGLYGAAVAALDEAPAGLAGG